MDNTAFKNPRVIIPLLMAILAPLKPLLMLINHMPWFGNFSDLPPLYAALRLIINGAGSFIYDAHRISKLAQSNFPGTREGVWTLLPPFSILWLTPLGLLPNNIAHCAWTCFLCALIVAAVCLSRLVFNLSLPATLWLFAVLSLFGPAFEAIRIGQLSPILLVLFLSAIWAIQKHRPILAGLCLSIMLLKPQLLLPVIVLLLSGRQYKPIIWLVGFASVMGALSLLVIGPTGYEQYLGRLSTLSTNTCGMTIEITPTVRGQLIRLFPNYLSGINIATLFVTLAGLVVVFAWTRRFSKRPDWLMISIACTLPLAFVTSTYFQIYDLLLLLPAILALITNDIGKQMPVWARFVGMALLVVYMLPVYLSLHYGYLLGGGAINPEFVALAFYVLVTQIFFLHGQALNKTN